MVRSRHSQFGGTGFDLGKRSTCTGSTILVSVGFGKLVSALAGVNGFCTSDSVLSWDDIVRVIKMGNVFT